MIRTIEMPAPKSRLFSWCRSSRFISSTWLHSWHLQVLSPWEWADWFLPCASCNFTLLRCEFVASHIQACHSVVLSHSIIACHGCHQAQSLATGWLDHGTYKLDPSPENTDVARILTLSIQVGEAGGLYSALEHPGFRAVPHWLPLGSSVAMLALVPAINFQIVAFPPNDSHLNNYFTIHFSEKKFQLINDVIC